MFKKHNFSYFNLNDKGIVMVAAMVFILTMMIFGICFILMIQTEVKEETVTEKFKNAFYCAEGGLARVKWLLQHDPQWRNASLTNDIDTVDIQGTMAKDSSYKIYLFGLPGQGATSPGNNIPVGTILWRYSLPDVSRYGSYPYDVQYLNNGNLLITEMHGLRRVFELTPNFEQGGGTIVWTYDNSRKMTGAKRMANGNTLVTEPHTDKGWAYEIKNDGTTIWEWKYQDYGNSDSWMQEADPLPNGNILITMRKADSPNKVVVVDYHTKNIIWSYDANFPTDADYLPNGNILITEKIIPGTDTGRVIEVDYNTKQIVWQVGGLENPRDADRLPNGNTVICEAGWYDHSDPDREGQISEVDPAGQWTLASPLMTDLARPHAVAIVPRANGDMDVLVANTGSRRGGRGNEILLIKGWSRVGGNRVAIVSVGDYLGCKNTVRIEADLDINTGILSNITWKEEKGVPVEFR